MLVMLLLLAGCANGDDIAATTSTVVSDTDVPETTASSIDDTTEPTEDAPPTEETTTTDTAEPDTTEAGQSLDEIGLLCTAYLDSISPSSFDQGLSGLAELLGDDAPSGVLGAIDTLQNPDNDVEAFFQAKNSIDSYVLPICEQRFRSGIIPLADDASAADAFVNAVRDGDRASAEGLAPTNVIVQFDWAGYPQTTADFNSDNSTLSLVLEPTVTVFCQLAGGAVEFCAFGE